MATPEIAPFTWTRRFRRVKTRISDSPSTHAKLRRNQILLPIFFRLRCSVFLCAGAGEDVPQCIISFMARVFENWSRSPDNRNFHAPRLGEGLQIVHSELIEKRVRIEPPEALREVHARAGAPDHRIHGRYLPLAVRLAAFARRG